MTSKSLDGTCRQLDLPVTGDGQSLSDSGAAGSGDGEGNSGGDSSIFGVVGGEGAGLEDAGSGGNVSASFGLLVGCEC